MELTAAEKEEFIALTRDSIDPELWLEDDLAFLRAIKREHKEEQEPEYGVLHAQQPNMTEDDEGIGADTGAADDE